MKSYAKFNNSPHYIHHGDVVLMRNEQKTNKLAPCFDPQPYTCTVVAKKGIMVFVSSGPRTDKCTTRNASYACFKKIPNTFAPDPVDPEIAEGEGMVLDRKIENTRTREDIQWR